MQVGTSSWDVERQLERYITTTSHGNATTCPIYMPLPSRGQSIVCAWREFELTNKSARWNVFLEVSNRRRRRTWFTHVRAALWSNIIQIFDNKKWSYDHLEGFV